jgi:hypothetical protein
VSSKPKSLTWLVIAGQFGGDEPVLQTPLLEEARTVLVDDVAVRYVAREWRPVDEEDSIAFTGQEHGRGSPTTTGADYDRVVHRSLLNAPSGAASLKRTEDNGEMILDPRRFGKRQPHSAGQLGHGQDSPWE